MSVSSRVARVTVEYPDGTVHEFKALTANVEGLSKCDNTRTILSYSFETEQISISTNEKDHWHTVQAKRSLDEWKCDYCGSINKRKETHCLKCGASRGFLYTN